MDQEEACTFKAKFKTYEAASKPSRDGKKFDVYKCDVCGFFHHARPNRGRGRIWKRRGAR